MNYQVVLTGWPKGTERETVAQPLRLTLDIPSGMLENPDHDALAKVLADLRIGLHHYVKRESGTVLQWHIESSK